MSRQDLRDWLIIAAFVAYYLVPVLIVAWVIR